LKEQLLLLKELQAVDARILELRASMESLPEKLKPAKQDLAKLEALLAREKAQLAETESWRREQEELIRREDEAVKQAKAKLQAAKSAKDYAAASREVENKRRSRSEREDEVLKVSEPLEATRQTVEAHEKDVDSLRVKIQEEEDALLARVKELEQEAASYQAERADKAAKVDPNLLRRYETVLARRGIAVVPVTAGTCGGCHMSLPPQLNNELARFESVENCPTCQRLLYRVELLDEGGDEG
jgi:uncharacterized protein